ncbi:hypothetical protein [Actinophytocola sediminis]
MTRAELMGGGPADGETLTLAHEVAVLRVPHCRWCSLVSLRRYTYRSVGSMDGRDGPRIVYLYTGEPR